MKTKLAASALLILVAAIAWTFVKRPLPVPPSEVRLLAAATAVEGVSLSVLRSAEMTAQKGFSVRGASLLKTFVTGIVAFVVTHPRGVLLIDAGVGRHVLRHLETTPFLMRTLADVTVKQPTIEALQEKGLTLADLEGVVLTHSHWDHVSGLADLRGVPVWMTPEELAHARTDDVGGKLFQQLEADRPFVLKELTFDQGPFGPFEASRDFFGDGSVILVPMPGHTPGSVGVFVTDARGKRTFVIGDTSWTREGVDWPAEKPWLARRMVDHDAAAVRDLLVTLHQLQEAEPDLLIVPAHDARVHEAISSF